MALNSTQVTVTNHTDTTYVLAGVEIAPGDNAVDLRVVEVLIELGLLSQSFRARKFTLDLSGVVAYGAGDVFGGSGDAEVV